jgi:hypothetical protein
MERLKLPFVGFHGVGCTVLKKVTEGRAPSMTGAKLLVGGMNPGGSEVSGDTRAGDIPSTIVHCRKKLLDRARERLGPTVVTEGVGVDHSRAAGVRENRLIPP